MVHTPGLYVGGEPVDLRLAFGLVSERYIRFLYIAMSSDLLRVPRHLRSPGDDGYRTPTIEDAEQTLAVLGVTDVPSLGAGANTRQVHTSALEAALQKVTSRATDQTASNKEFSHCVDRDGPELTRKVTDASASRLSWKKRIRHVTWAYFTLTMATGGLANVLYEGNSNVHTA